MATRGDHDRVAGEGDYTLHSICPDVFTYAWDNSIEPVLQVDSGSIVEFTVRDAYVSMGVAPDLMEATRDAVRTTMEHAGDSHGLAREEAYALCSVVVDLRIHEVVDAPNWVVGAFLPDDIFTGGGNL